MVLNLFHGYVHKMLQIIQNKQFAVVGQFLCLIYYGFLLTLYTVSMSLGYIN